MKNKEFTKNNILSNYLRQVTEEKDIIKLEIKAFFDAEINNPNLYESMSVAFSDKVTAFSNKYGLSYPESLEHETIYKLNSLKATFEIYKDLLFYPDFLMSTL